MDHKQLKKTWKRREIGVRIPDSPILAELLAQLDGCVGRLAREFYRRR